YLAPTCKKEGTGPGESGPKSTVIGQETATVYIAGLAKKSLPPDVSLSGTLYNLEQPNPPATPRASLFGAALKLPIGLTKGVLEELKEAGFPIPNEALTVQYYGHTLVEGNVEWGKEAKGTNAGDYHDYFEVT